jgi:hypothetical protein
MMVLALWSAEQEQPGSAGHATTEGMTWGRSEKVAPH